MTPGEAVDNAIREYFNLPSNENDELDWLYNRLRSWSVVGDLLGIPRGRVRKWRQGKGLSAKEKEDISRSIKLSVEPRHLVGHHVYVISGTFRWSAKEVVVQRSDGYVSSRIDKGLAVEILKAWREQTIEELSKTIADNIDSFSDHLLGSELTEYTGGSFYDNYEFHIR